MFGRATIRLGIAHILVYSDVLCFGSADLGYVHFLQMQLRLKFRPDLS